MVDQRLVVLKRSSIHTMDKVAVLLHVKVKMTTMVNQEMMTLVCIHKSVQSHLHAFHTLNKFQHKVCCVLLNLFVDTGDQGSGNPTTGGDSETLGM